MITAKDLAERLSGRLGGGPSGAGVTPHHWFDGLDLAGHLRLWPAHTDAAASIR